jgi:hypothetical protein
MTTEQLKQEYINILNEKGSISELAEKCVVLAIKVKDIEHSEIVPNRNENSEPTNY